MATATQPASPFLANLPEFSSLARKPAASCTVPHLCGGPGFHGACLAVAAPKRKRMSMVVCAFGDVSSDSTIYLIAGAVAVALVGTALPILFSRKDLCPQCDGAGFIRQAGSTLRTNAARKDLSQIVCPRCSGLGKLGQIDKL